MKTQSKLRKKSFTIVEQACHEIHGFSKLYQELQDKVTLSGQTLSTLSNYARKLAHLSLHFGKLPCKLPCLPFIRVSVRNGSVSGYDFKELR